MKLKLSNFVTCKIWHQEELVKSNTQLIADILYLNSHEEVMRTAVKHGTSGIMYPHPLKITFARS